MRARFHVGRPLLLAAVLAGVAFVQPRARSGGWRIAMLPDTQHYSDSAVNIVHFEAQTQWIADHLAREGLEFVTHAGDIVQTGAQGAGMNQVEWDRAMGAMATLDGDLGADPDGLVPYSAVPGNHDFDVVGDKSSWTQFAAHFGPQRYAGRSWFAGASPQGTSFAQRFMAGGREFLALGLEWLPSDGALAWAQSMLDAHPRTPAVLTTHEYLELGVPASRRTSGDTPDASGDNSGESLFRKLVEPNPQLFLVLCGHVHGDGRATSTTALGATVHEVLADYQTDPNGGNGWMKLVELRELTGEIESQTFSPTYVPGATLGADRSLDPTSNFVLPFDLAAHRASLAQRELRRFRAGLGGDASFEVHDTHVGDGGAGVTQPDVAHGALDSLRVDGDADHEQALLRFAGFVGLGPEQVPPGVLVERAILTLSTEGSSSSTLTGARLHRMLVDWSEDSTWDSLGAGVQVGPEASAVVELDLSAQIASKGADSFDVTASVQAWVDGEPNLGWVALANGIDRWGVRSSEWPALAERPMLTVLFSGACRAVTRYCVGAPNSAGAGAVLDHSGSTSVSADDLVLTATGLPPFQPALFFYGPSQTQVPFGDGFLCVAPGARGIFRLNPPLAADGGSAMRAFELDQPPAGAGPGAIEAGSTWNVQLWYRDPANAASGFNLSDALALHFCG